MGALSIISGQKAVKIFKKFRYIIDHQTGSHIILYHQSRPTLSTDHKELAPGLLHGFIRKSGLSFNDFIDEK
jgi:predicted RNA binding protein YcfA (HicA-like mRNA interferase family)